MALHSPTVNAALADPRQALAGGNLRLTAKLIVEGVIAGLHRSPYHGFSAEFREYRPYIPGESARSIDWRKYAKIDRSVVRLHDDETNLFAHVLFDKSASMGFASPGMPTKFVYGRALAASLAWLLIRQRDGVGLSVFDEEVRLSLPPRSTGAHLRLLLGHLERLSPSGATGCGGAINHVAHRLRKRGMSIIISDFLDDPLAIARGLRHLRFKRQDVVAFCVLDPLELDFDLRGSLRVEDVETGARVSLDAQTASQYYRAGFTDHRQELQSLCRDLEIDLHVVRTSQPLGAEILHALERRSRLH